MRCDLCKKKRATVHLTPQEQPGAEIKVNLCADCAKRYGVGDPTGFDLADLFAAFRKK